MPRASNRASVLARTALAHDQLVVAVAGIDL